MNDLTPSPATPTQTKPHMPRSLTAALIALALLIVFEVGVRCIQPDTLVYTATIGDGPVMAPTYHHVHQTIHDPHAVAQWYAAVSARPLDNVVFSFFAHCNGLYYLDESYRFEFTWHGLPVETANSVGTSCGPELRLTSGRIPSLREYALPNPLPNAIP